MIIAGLGLILFGIGRRESIGISNLWWSHGGFMPNGFIGFFALSIVIGSYQGVELIGISAGETKILANKYCKGSQRSDMENFNFLYWCNFVIVSVYPWNQLGSIGSPFGNVC